MVKRTDAGQEIEIVNRYKSGEEVNSIATAIGIDRVTVFRILKRSGTELRVVWKERSPEQEAQIVECYRLGSNANAISVATGIPVATVRRVIKRGGVELRDDGRVELDVEQRLHVVDCCLDGDSREHIAKLFGISQQTVTRILKANDVSMKMGRRPSCALNHNAFDILTPDVKYWMGVLFTDGSQPADSEGSQSIAMHIAAIDRRQLEKLRDFLGSSHAICDIPAKDFMIDGHVVHSGPSVHYRIRSERLAAALAARGMARAKPDRLAVQELADSPDFWRGCVDSDGTVRARSDNGYAAFSLCGHLPLLAQFKKFLRDLDIADLEIGRTTSGIFRLGTDGSNALEIVRVLYGHTNGNVALDRKLTTAQKLLGQI